ncbi:MAG: hypothetical protein E7231_00445 [Cellulosilyticum sp.]|nr:hypothetical protein [Cellulosilyticum sp.]
MSSKVVKIEPILAGWVDAEKSYFSGGYPLKLGSYPLDTSMSFMANGYVKFDKDYSASDLKLVVETTYARYSALGQTLERSELSVYNVLSDWSTDINYSTQPQSVYKTYRTIENGSVTSRFSMNSVSKYGLMFGCGNLYQIINVSDVYLEYTEYTPDVTNFTVTGTSLDSPTTVEWEQADTTSWILQAIKNGNVIAIRQGTTETSCTFNVGELQEGSITFKLVATNSVSTEVKKEITMNAPVASVSDFTVSGTSIDNTITCTAKQENVYNWSIQAIQNGVVKATKIGTGNISATFNVGKFNVGGNTIFKLTYSNTWNGGSTEQTVNLSYTQASISLLELPNSTINVDEAFTISWVSSNQTSFSLEVDGNIYTGTTQKSVTIPKGTIGKGYKTVKLTVTFSNTYYSNTATSSQGFTAYGTPSTPILNIKSVYNTATPTLSWQSNEQVTYKVTIKRQLTTIEETEEIISTNKYYLVTTALENSGNYTISVKVKNKYGLWSAESTGEFQVTFNVPPPPTIQAISDITTGSIIITVITDITNSSEYKNTEIWKRESGGVWKRMAYKLNATDIWSDFYVAGNTNYEYKARNIGQSGGISESEIIIGTTTVTGFNFYDIQDNTNFLRFTTGENPKPKINQSITSNLFAGSDAPTNFGDGVLYWTCTLSFKTDNQEDIARLVQLMKAKLLLYKDNKGHKWFGNITNSPDFTEDDVNDITILLEFSQSQFTEEDVYSGDNIELISWNGGWKFVGTHIYGGE